MVYIFCHTARLFLRALHTSRNYVKADDPTVTLMLSSDIFTSLTASRFFPKKIHTRGRFSHDGGKLQAATSHGLMYDQGARGT